MDCFSYLSNKTDNVFLTASDAFNTTISVGLDISNDSSLESISESERFVPLISVFCSRFSAFISKTTSFAP